MNYGSWHLNHPGKAMLLLIICMAITGALGVGGCALWVHDPGNILGAVAWGMGGTVAGAVVGFVIIDLINVRDAGRRPYR